jgi:ABC-2 type transport system permease protein
MSSNSASAQTAAMLPRPLSRARRELNAVVAIVARDILLSLKSPGFLIMTLAMPLVLLGMLGGSLAQNMASGLGFDFSQYMLVGMMVNMLFMMTCMGLTSLVDDRDLDFMADMMVSPVSRYALVVGKIIGSSFGALIGMVGTLIVGMVMGIALSVGQILLMLALAPIICLAGGAFAMIIIGSIRSNRTANLSMMIIVFPQMFLSGVLIPIANSTGILLVVSRILPMTYAADLMRAVVFAGTPEYSQVVLFNPMLSLAVVLVLIVVCLLLGTWLFARSEKRR